MRHKYIYLAVRERLSKGEVLEEEVSQRAAGVRGYTVAHLGLGLVSDRLLSAAQQLSHVLISGDQQFFTFNFVAPP